MTSYPARINAVGVTMLSILEGSLRPDLIVCNLSIPEFPNRINDLPPDLQLMAKLPCIQFNWVSRNTKQFKKIIPTLDLYPNAVIISVDDDLIYPGNFLRTIVSDYNRYQGRYPITCGHFIDYNYYRAKPSHHGSFSLVTRSMFGKNYARMKELISTHLWNEIWFDDPLYTYAIMDNGLEYKLGSFNGFEYKKRFQVDGVSNKNEFRRHGEHVFLQSIFKEY